MTPNPESPIFKQDFISEYASEEAKKLGEIYRLIKEDAKQGKWKGLSEDNVTLEYNNYDGCTVIEAILTDSNHHTHHFTIQFLPDNGFGDGTNYLYLKYLFEGEFDENVLSVRSFAEYLATYLEWEGFEPILIHCDKGIEWLTKIDWVYKGYCNLVETTLSKLKPIDWFYSDEPLVSSYDDMHYYFLKIFNKLKSRVDWRKWDGIKADCFNIISAADETSIYLEYQVDEVWKWLITLNGIWNEKYPELSINISCYPYYKLSKEIEKKLDTLFAEFLDSLPSSNGNIWIGGGRGEHSLGIQYFHIEDSLDLFCNLLDELTSHLKSFNFHLSSPSTTLTEEMETMKKQLEESLQTTLSFVTEEDEINKKLKNGYFVV
ncbi:MAG: hypothetical protein NC111_05910 [Bacteroides sp.]|nr:hypothetical protein [Bacteroides sp.]MCM1412718.1 hypothetical protein [Bacteroides sp.]MCM1472043.1 hypothetical protein [Bacteroides sp.]